MNPFIRKIGFGVLLATLFLPLHSCGLGEDSRDEDNRYVYLRFADPAFEAYCLEHWDLNGDGRISRYEAQRVWDMDCSSLGVKTLAGIEEFTALRKLDCSGNEIVALDVRKCIFMEQLNCSGNALISLDIKGLRFLNRLDCSNRPDLYQFGYQCGFGESLVWRQPLRIARHQPLCYGHDPCRYGP